MYHFLKGTITEKITEPPGSEKLIIDVNGVGYEVQTTFQALSLFGKKGDLVTVYTTLICKENEMFLIGFPTFIERELFNLLYSVSGVGPKTALNLLNNLTVSEITYSILQEDTSCLCTANGIGEKTASRIILELKGKIKDWSHLPIVYKDKGARSSELGVQSSGLAYLSEARSVLQSLGYSSSEINQAFSQAKANGGSENTESLIQFSLRWLATVRK